ACGPIGESQMNASTPTISPSPDRRSGSRSTNPLDIALQIQRHGMLNFFESTWRRNGDLAPLRIASHTIFPIVHPDHVRRINVDQRERYGKEASYEDVRKLLLGNGLVVSNGALWRRQRKLMAPFFTPRAIQTYLPVIVEDGAWFRERWNAAAGRG